MKFLLGFIAGLIIVPIGAYVYLRLGLAPVATAAPPLPFEERLAHMALDSAIAKHGQAQPAIQPTEANLTAGAKTYHQQCAVCHGFKGQPKSAIAQGMFPKPPQLLQGKGVTDDPASETYWKVANGIRLTGMPAFTGSLSDEQMWQVSLMLAQADKLPEAATRPLVP